jgi:hypothetical protein
MSSSASTTSTRTARPVHAAPIQQPPPQPPPDSPSRIPVTPAVLRSIFASSRTPHEERSISRVAFFRYHLPCWLVDVVLNGSSCQVHWIFAELRIHKRGRGERSWSEEQRYSSWGSMSTERIELSTPTSSICPLNQRKSTPRRWGDITATTLLDKSNTPPPSYATMSISSSSISGIPKSLSKLVETSAYACF